MATNSLKLFHRVFAIIVVLAMIVYSTPCRIFAATTGIPHSRWIPWPEIRFAQDALAARTCGTFGHNAAFPVRRIWPQPPFSHPLDNSEPYHFGPTTTDLRVYFHSEYGHSRYAPEINLLFYFLDRFKFNYAKRMVGQHLIANPDDNAYHIMLAIIYEAQNNNAVAQLEATQALSKPLQDIRLLRIFIQCLIRLDRLEDVLALNRQELELEPRNGLAYNTKARTYFAKWVKSGKRQDLTEAITAGRQAASILKSEKSYIFLAQMLKKNNQIDTAIATLEEARHLFPQDRNIHQLLHEYRKSTQSLDDPYYGARMPALQPLYDGISNTLAPLLGDRLAWWIGQALSPVLVESGTLLAGFQEMHTKLLASAAIDLCIVLGLRLVWQLAHYSQYKSSSHPILETLTASPLLIVTLTSLTGAALLTPNYAWSPQATYGVMALWLAAFCLPHLIVDARGTGKLQYQMWQMERKANRESLQVQKKYLRLLSADTDGVSKPKMRLDRYESVGAALEEIGVTRDLWQWMAQHDTAFWDRVVSWTAEPTMEDLAGELSPYDSDEEAVRLAAKRIEESPKLLGDALNRILTAADQQVRLQSILTQATFQVLTSHACRTAAEAKQPEVIEALTWGMMASASRIARRQNQRCPWLSLSVGTLDGQIGHQLEQLRKLNTAIKPLSEAWKQGWLYKLHPPAPGETDYWGTPAFGYLLRFRGHWATYELFTKFLNRINFDYWPDLMGHAIRQIDLLNEKNPSRHIRNSSLEFLHELSAFIDDRTNMPEELKKTTQSIVQRALTRYKELAHLADHGLRVGDSRQNSGSKSGKNQSAASAWTPHSEDPSVPAAELDTWRGMILIPWIEQYRGQYLLPLSEDPEPITPDAGIAYLTDLLTNNLAADLFVDHLTIQTEPLLSRMGLNFNEVHRIASNLREALLLAVARATPDFSQRRPGHAANSHIYFDWRIGANSIVIHVIDEAWTFGIREMTPPDVDAIAALLPDWTVVGHALAIRTDGMPVERSPIDGLRIGTEIIIAKLGGLGEGDPSVIAAELNFPMDLLTALGWQQPETHHSGEHPQNYGSLAGAA